MVTSEFLEIDVVLSEIRYREITANWPLEGFHTKYYSSYV